MSNIQGPSPAFDDDIIALKMLAMSESFARFS